MIVCLFFRLIKLFCPNIVNKSNRFLKNILSEIINLELISLKKNRWKKIPGSFKVKWINFNYKIMQVRLKIVFEF